MAQKEMTKYKERENQARPRSLQRAREKGRRELGEKRFFLSGGGDHP